jgi:hypothetical protein
MNSDLKFRIKLNQLNDALKRLNQYKGKGLGNQVEETQALIDTLSKEIKILSKELDEWDQ